MGRETADRIVKQLDPGVFLERTPAKNGKASLRLQAKPNVFERGQRIGEKHHAKARYREIGYSLKRISHGISGNELGFSCYRGGRVQGPRVGPREHRL